MNYFMDIAKAKEEIAALKYGRSRDFDRLKELAEMYKAHGFMEAYAVLIFAAAMLEANNAP